MATGGEKQPTSRTARAQRTVRPQGVRGLLGELACGQCSSRLKEDKIQACQQGNIIKDVAQAKKSRISSTFLGSQQDTVASKLAETAYGTTPVYAPRLILPLCTQGTGILRYGGAGSDTFEW